MCRNSEIPMQVPTKLLCFFQTNFEICKTHFCPSSPSFSVGMDKFLTLNFIFLPIARWMFNLWLCIIQKHLMKIWYVVLHRTHLNNANKLLVFSLPFPVEFQQCQWVRHRTDVGGTVLHSKIVKTYRTPKPTEKFYTLSAFSFWSFNTDDKCSNQIWMLPNNRAHWELRWKRDGLLTVRRTGNWRATWIQRST